MNCREYVTIFAMFLIVSSGLGAADVLPEPIPENQVFTTTSVVEGVSMVYESTSVVWEVGDASLTSLPHPAVQEDLKSILSGSIAYATYFDSIATNGGQISEVKSFSMDTHAKDAGLYNIGTAKVLTYTSQNGSHLMGKESYVLDVAGNWSRGASDLVCVFSRAEDETIPAFCNKVTASSKLQSVTSAQLETVGGLTAVGNTPAALGYMISVTPENNAAYADGIVSTTFTVNVMEGRSDGDIIGSSTAVGGTGYWEYRSFLGNSWLYYINGNDYLWLTRDNGSTGDLVQLGVGGSPVFSDATAGGSNFPDGATFNPAPSYTIVAPAGGTTFILTVTAGPPADNPLGIAPGVYTINTANGNAEGVMFAQPIIGPYLTGYNELASTLTHTDTATVAGGITTFSKAFNYQSGIACDTC